MKFMTEADIDFSDNGLLEQVWQLPMDDLSNPITEVMIDTLPKNRINIYVLYQNYKMRKYSSIIPYI